jgi:hypothetical protein
MIMSRVGFMLLLNLPTGTLNFLQLVAAVVVFLKYVLFVFRQI